MAKFCVHCGKEIEAGSGFCPFCGVKLEAPGTDALQGPVTEVLQEPRAEAPKAAPPRAEAPKAVPPRAEPPKAAPPRAEAPKAAPPRAEAPRPQPPRAAAPLPPLEEGKTGKGLGWISFMRVILWLIFIAGVMTSLIFVVESNMLERETGMAILVLAGGVLGSLILVAGGMIMLNNATNIRSTAINTAKLVRLMQMQEKK